MKCAEAHLEESQTLAQAAKNDMDSLGSHGNKPVVAVLLPKSSV